MKPYLADDQQLLPEDQLVGSLLVDIWVPRIGSIKWRAGLMGLCFPAACGSRLIGNFCITEQGVEDSVAVHA